MAKDPHTERVMREMREAGVGRFGMMRFAARYLPRVIHKDEHVHGVVNGRYREEPQGMALIEGMLVATDRRVIFLDHKPAYTKMEEMTYDIVAGVDLTKAGPFSGVVLHTRLGDFGLRFVNPKCATNFVEYVESRRLESEENASDID